jgi:glycerophosphoryl diester phosphodiesterase
MPRHITLALIAAAVAGGAVAEGLAETEVHLGPRPFYLIENMDDGALKETLAACQSGPFARSNWSIGHRGAPLMFPEHTVESNRRRRAHGRRHPRMRRDLHHGQGTGLPPRAERSAHHHQHPGHRSGGEVHHALQPGLRATDPARAECRTSEITLESSAR